MSYNPARIGEVESLEGLRQYVQEELEKISKEFNETIALDLRTVHAEPGRPREGMIVSADGLDWNPGSGAGAYEFVGGAWRRVAGVVDGDYGDITISGGVWTIDNDAVTYAKIQNVVNDDRFLGRISGADGVIEELTGTQATTLLDVFTSGLKGLVPASGGNAAHFLSADGTFKTAGAILQTLQDTYVANADLTTPLPIDDSVPGSGEGTEILSQAITLGSASNKVLIFVDLFGSVNNQEVAFAIFRGTTCIFAKTWDIRATTIAQSAGAIWLDTPGSVGPHTYSVRVGSSSGTAVRLNGDMAGRYFGGVGACTLTLQEAVA